VTWHPPSCSSCGGQRSRLPGPAVHGRRITLHAQAPSPLRCCRPRVEGGRAATQVLGRPAQTLVCCQAAAAATCRGLSMACPGCWAVAPAQAASLLPQRLRPTATAPPHCAHACNRYVCLKERNMLVTHMSWNYGEQPYEEYVNRYVKVGGGAPAAATAARAACSCGQRGRAASPPARDFRRACRVVTGGRDVICRSNSR
jgi:hypothetical protein